MSINLQGHMYMLFLYNISYFTSHFLKVTYSWIVYLLSGRFSKLYCREINILFLVKPTLCEHVLFHKALLNWIPRKYIFRWIALLIVVLFICMITSRKMNISSLVKSMFTLHSLAVDGLISFAHNLYLTLWIAYT